ncbi:MarR family winged helix-turn-helix transcriptional regulator [Cellulomonas sp. C5510]|uniref:MarR family winged helix-turn-helix transcriptional regulator n=1 Tax=Cellulomonas sp. C5510 TaxID=2871170 RepID=UPI001C971E17|nr:MarR family transcriptional regulator [Cellulomonas sp. C5510]QZN86474.1 MarR family transcriptional regulator [Cellulomonas sp. C5510]
MTAVTDTHQSDLGWSLGVLLRAYERGLTSALADVPHGFRGFLVLREVVRGAHPSQAALAASLGIDRTVMTYLLDDLERAGLVTRRVAEVDRRQRRVLATPDTEGLLADLEQRVARAEDAVFGALDPSDRRTVSALLRRAACEYRDSDPDEHPCAVVEQALGG